MFQRHPRSRAVRGLPLTAQALGVLLALAGLGALVGFAVLRWLQGVL